MLKRSTNSGTTNPTFQEIFDQLEQVLIVPILYSLFLQSSFENGTLLAKLFGPTVRKKFSSAREKLLKSESDGLEFAKIWRSIEQNAFLLVPGGFHI